MADAHMVTPMSGSLCGPTVHPHRPQIPFSTVRFLTKYRRPKPRQGIMQSHVWGSVLPVRVSIMVLCRVKRKSSSVPIVFAQWDPEPDGEGSSRDDFGIYPWDPSWQSASSSVVFSDVSWIQEDVVTLFTSDGMVRIGGARLVSGRGLSSFEKKNARLRAFSRQRRFREENYMDPKQGLCLGAVFNIAATNGLDMGRRFCVFGFCRSIEMLSDVVEDTVIDQGGEVVVAEKESTGGLHEKLKMTVAMPLLWGVPPAVDVLNHAIRSGGGIVERTYRKWEFL